MDARSPAFLVELWKRIAAEPKPSVFLERTQKAMNQSRQRKKFKQSKMKVKRGPYVRQRPEYEPYNPHLFDDERPCCNNKCFSLWGGRDDEIQTFRSAITRGLSPEEKRQIYFSHAVTLGGGRKCCHKWLKCVYGTFKCQVVWSKDTVQGACRHQVHSSSRGSTLFERSRKALINPNCESP